MVEMKTTRIVPLALLTFLVFGSVAYAGPGSLKVTVVDEDGCQVSGATACVQKNGYYKIDYYTDFPNNLKIYKKKSVGYKYITDTHYRKEFDEFAKKVEANNPPEKLAPKPYVKMPEEHKSTDISGSSIFEGKESGRYYISVTHPDYYGNYQIDKGNPDSYKDKATYETGYVYPDKETEVKVTIRKKPVFTSGVNKTSSKTQ